MAKRKEVHTVPTDVGWANKAWQPHPKQPPQEGAAQAAGRKQAIQRKAEHVIHKKDGTIGAKKSFGNDPRRTKG